MANDLSIATVRLALGLQDLRARTAADNIANLNRSGTQTMRLDDAASSFLASIPELAGQDGLARSVNEAADAVRGAALQPAGDTTADREVADMVEAGAAYQTLTEVLGRQFALLRLSIAGRS